MLDDIPVQPPHGLRDAPLIECCTYPVLEWTAEYLPAAPVNVMAQFHPDNFCDPASDKYREKYAEIARRPTRAELHASWQRAYELGLNFEITTSIDLQISSSRSAALECPLVLQERRKSGHSARSHLGQFHQSAP